MFCLLVVPVRLSVPVQVIDWKDSSPKMTYNVLMGTINPTHSLTHSLAHSLTHSVNFLQSIVSLGFKCKLFMSLSTTSLHVFVGPPLCLVASISKAIHPFTQLSSSAFKTCPHRRNLFLYTTFSMFSIPTTGSFIHVYSLDSVGVHSRCLDLMPGTVCLIS